MAIFSFLGQIKSIFAFVGTSKQQKTLVPKFRLVNHHMFEYQQGKISEKWPNFVDLIWPQVNRPNFMNLERISSGERIAAEFSVPNSIFALPATGTT